VSLFELDAAAGEVRLELSKKLYSSAGLKEAALAVAESASVKLDASGPRIRATLASRKEVAPEGLVRLAGEFLNEALNQDRRRDVLGSERETIRLIATRALVSVLQSEEQERRSKEITAQLDGEAAALIRELRGGGGA
jgi:hypothetical protein